MNTQADLVTFLKANPGLTEKQIQEQLWGVYRKKENRKKHADLLRRALTANKIYRATVIGAPYKYIYFATK